MDEKNINSLIILREVLHNSVFSAFIKYAEHGKDKDFAAFTGKLIECGGECNFKQYMADVILHSVNAVSLACARGQTPSNYAKKAYLRDIKMIFNYIDIVDDKGFYDKGYADYPFGDGLTDDALFARIKKFYRKNGYGIFINYKAFIYTDGTFRPIENPSPVTLAELKDYEYEKKIIEDNIYNFIHGLPYSNMLLYGDRGTGKSSTIHAMLNKYSKEGLRIIEINKENMLLLPEIRQKLKSNPLKFLIYIDDLSLNENDDKISGLKAALEGSVAGDTENTMIVATSNRRHIIKENFSDRNDSVHRNDSIQEQLSLSDRFGITVMFSSTDKASYISIIRQLAADAKLVLEDDKLCALAERWALVKGGRSPRRARQFIDLALSCQKKKTEIEF